MFKKGKTGLDYLRDLFGFGKKADVPATTTKETGTVKDILSKYDETTQPGQFKKQGEIIDEEGTPVVKEYSYNPESFTDTQKRTGVGSFSDDALREQYMDSVDSEIMSFDEYVIKQRGITPEQLEAERLARAKPVGEIPKGTSTGSRPTVENFIERVKLSSPFIRTEEQIKQAIVNIANQGYEAGSPKLMSIDDTARINAFLDNKLMYNTRDMEDFIDEFFEELKEMGISESTASANNQIESLLMKSLDEEQSKLLEAAAKTNKEVALRAEESLAAIKMLEDMGIDTSSLNKDIFLSPPTTQDSTGVKQFADESQKLFDLFQKEIGSARGLSTADMGKSLESINAQASADQALADQLMNEVVQKAEMGQYSSRKEAQKALAEIKEKFDKIPQAKEDAIKSGVYVSPFETKRTLNAKGGRIGFADGDFVSPEDIITRPADNEGMMAEYMAKVESGELVYDPETKQFIPAPKKRRRQNTRPADNEEYIADLMYRMKMNEMYGKKDGGRIGFSAGGRDEVGQRLAERDIKAEPMMNRLRIQAIDEYRKQNKIPTNQVVEIEGNDAFQSFVGNYVNKGMNQMMEQAKDFSKEVDLPLTIRDYFQTVGIGPFTQKSVVDMFAADGGRVGLKDGGGPKMGRRGFLGLLGAGAASLMLPFGKIASKAPVGAVTQAVQKVPGMPEWFPLLVNRIRTKGKVKREPGYAEYTGGGDLEKVYELDGYTLYEDMGTGRITVSGRGNDYQQVSMEYSPGETQIVSKKDPITGEMKRGSVTNKPTFEAGEYAKGDPYDYENVGVDYDDLKGDLSNWEKFATGGRKLTVKEADKGIDDFIEKFTNPTIVDDMAKGGRVGMAQGGIASKFKERVSYGN